MEKRKKRIEAFIAGHLDSRVESGAIIVGGKGQDPAIIMSSTNGLDCVNDNYQGCNKSTNKGSCKNVSGMCNNSKNELSCDNSYIAIVNPDRDKCK